MVLHGFLVSSTTYNWLVTTYLQCGKKMMMKEIPSPNFNHVSFSCTGVLRYDRPLYDGFLHITDDMLGPSPMHIKYSSYLYDRFCI